MRSWDLILQASLPALSIFLCVTKCRTNKSTKRWNTALQHFALRPCLTSYLVAKCSLQTTPNSCPLHHHVLCVQHTSPGAEKHLVHSHARTLRAHVLGWYKITLLFQNPYYIWVCVPFGEQWTPEKYFCDRTPFDPGDGDPKLKISKIHGIWRLKFEPVALEGWDLS